MPIRLNTAGQREIKASKEFRIRYMQFHFFHVRFVCELLVSHDIGSLQKNTVCARLILVIVSHITLLSARTKHKTSAWPFLQPTFGEFPRENSIHLFDFPD